MEYRFRQLGGGGKDGSDPIYHFTLDSTRPLLSGAVEKEVQTPPFNKRSDNPNASSENLESSEKPRKKKQNDQVEGPPAAVAAEAKAQPLSPFKIVPSTASPSIDAPPRYPAPARSNGIKNINNLSQHQPSSPEAVLELTPPEPNRTLVQTHTMTSSLNTPRLSLKLGFLKSLLEDTLGIVYNKDLSLSVCRSIDGCQESIFAKICLKGNNFLSRWYLIRPLLGGIALGDKLIFNYLGNKRNNTNNMVYYFTLKKESNNKSSSSGGDTGTNDAARAPAAAASADADESMDNLLKELEKWNNKFDDDASSLMPRMAPIERKLQQKSPTAAAPASVAPPSALPMLVPSKKEATHHLSVSLLRSAGLLNSRSESPSLATEPEDAAEGEEMDGVDGNEEEEEEEAVSLLKPKRKMLMLQPSKLPDFRSELNPPSVLQTCAKEINALESLMSSIAANAAAAEAAAVNVKKKCTSLLNMHRHRLAKLFIDSEMATQALSGSNTVRGVYYNHSSSVFFKYLYKEQSLWCKGAVGRLRPALLDDLRNHGATMSYSLETVLGAQWPYQVWVGDMNNTSLLPAGVGVVALEDIPAGSFVAQFIGEYISWKDLPEASSEVINAYTAEEAEIEEPYTQRDEQEKEKNDTSGNEIAKGLAREDDCKIGFVASAWASKHLWVGNITPNCTESALEDVFSEYGDVVSTRVLNKSQRRRPYAFVNFTDVCGAENARNKLQGSKISGLTGEKRLVIDFKGADSKRASDGGGGDAPDGDVDHGEDVYYFRNRHSQATKRYRVHIAVDTECVVPADIPTSTEKQKHIVVKACIPFGGKDESLCNNQWRRLGTTIIDSISMGNATHFMRRSDVNYNLARVQLNVPNGPTKILYYSNRHIQKGEELVREP